MQVGSGPSTAPMYYYVYNSHGDVVNLVDATAAVVASYAYDAWGNPTSASEAIPNANGWVNPYRYDGRFSSRLRDWLRASTRWAWYTMKAVAFNDAGVNSASCPSSLHGKAMRHR